MPTLEEYRENPISKAINEKLEIIEESCDSNKKPEIKTTNFKQSEIPNTSFDHSYGDTAAKIMLEYGGILLDSNKNGHLDVNCDEAHNLQEANALAYESLMEYWQQRNGGHL